MSCNCNNKSCNCNFNIKNYGLCDTSRISIDGSDRTALNWSEISVPEILCVPVQKPDIENIDQVYADTDLTSVKLIETPLAYDSYDILATAQQVATATAVFTTVQALGAQTATVLTDIAAILALPGLPISPLLDQLQSLEDQLTIAQATFNAAVADALTTAGTANVTVKEICAAITAVTDAIINIQTILTELLALANLMAADADLNAVAGFTAANTTLIADTTTALATIVTDLALLANLESMCSDAVVIVIKPNAEGTCLSGRKLVIEGLLRQKVVYTANVETQSVHSADYCVPFSAFVIPYANFENATYEKNVPVLIDGTATTVNGFVLGDNETLIPNLCEEFCVEAFIEDIFSYAIDFRTIFKNVTLFLLAKVSKQCV